MGSDMKSFAEELKELVARHHKTNPLAELVDALDIETAALVDEIQSNKAWYDAPQPSARF